jgi:hypothetical protein
MQSKTDKKINESVIFEAKINGFSICWIASLSSLLKSDMLLGKFMSCGVRISIVVVFVFVTAIKLEIEIK